MNSEKAPDTILVVDDEPEILDILAHMLSKYRVLKALNVAQAQQLISSERCALVVTDVRMPGPSGATLVTYLKEKSPETPVIVISGHGPGDTPEPGPSGEHVFRWIRKPFRRTVLLEAVDSALGGASGAAPAPKR